jgi:hypothetical protein
MAAHSDPGLLRLQNVFIDEDGSAGQISQILLIVVLALISFFV